MELTRFNGRTDGRRYSIYEYEGREIRVFDSAITGLRLIKLFEREDIDPLNKEWAVLQILFPNPEGVQKEIEDLNGLISMLCWEICGLDLTGAHEIESKGEKAFDWDSDSQLIKTSLYQAYGVSWEVLTEEVTYRDLTSMMGFIPFETPLGQAIHYRIGEPPEPTEHNQEQIKTWNERAEFWRIKGENEDTEYDRIEAMNNEMNDLFASLARSANVSRR